MTRPAGPLVSGSGPERLAAAVVAELEAHVGPDAVLAVACSGGPDSLALGRLLAQVRPDARRVVVHVRHGLRDDAPDAAISRAHAEALGARWVERRVSVTGRGGVEAAARVARWDALADAARGEGADLVVLAHTADDRAESVALALGRGAGADGLGAMGWVRQHRGMRFVRPLLAARRGDVRAVVADAVPPPAVDPSNDDPARGRTLARNRVLPAIGELSGGPGDPVAVLWRTAELAAADAAALAGIAAVAVPLTVWGPLRAMCRRDLQAVPAAVGARAIRRLLRAAGAASGPSSADVAAVRDLGDDDAVTVAGAIAVGTSQGWVTALGPGDGVVRTTPAVDGATVAPLHRVVRIVQGASTSHEASAQWPAWCRGPRSLRLDEATANGAVLRGPRPGDRIALSGGTRRVVDVLADAGVPRHARPLTPLLCAADGAVRWVAGIAVAAATDGPVTCTLAAVGPASADDLG